LIKIKKGHYKIKDFDIVHFKQFGTWFIYKNYENDKQKCLGSRAYLKDAKDWVLHLS